MNSLKGKAILIGKEPGQGRLLVGIEGGRTAAIGGPGSVPNSVSRYRAAEGVAHARITVDNNGDMTLINMKPQNVTYVDGKEIDSKRITATNTIELGKDRYRINPAGILETAKKLIDSVPPPPPPGPFNISHLEHVWNDLQAKKKEIQARQKKINLVRSGCGVFTMCAMPTISLIGAWGFALTGVGILGNIYSFIGLKKDDTSEVIEQLTEDFQDRYVCPNPDCNKFLGNLSYKLLKRQYSMHCPYCKCEYVEK